MTIMVRAITISVGTWAALLPLLCVGGLVDHHCDCGDEAVCKHEGDCAADPCQALILASSDSSIRSRLRTAIAPRSLVTTELFVAAGADSRLDFDCAAVILDLKRLPFPPSDLPLLV